ncbi:MAG: hypothetical protein JNL52_14830 [Flavobacteriales bacterium]|nr:hypothetical protein [Flavobacteriales bacterium]
MRALLTIALVAIGLAACAQNTIYSHAIGNWRNGPVVYITPLIEASEAMTKAQLLERFRAEYPELKNIPASDLDVLLFGTREEGDDSRRTLQSKYGVRKLQVVMLEKPKDPAITVPADHH